MWPFFTRLLPGLETPSFLKHFFFKRVFLFFLIIAANAVNAQPAWVVVDSISVSGNRKTQLSSVLRELPFAPGDSIPLVQLESQLEEGEKWLLQTGLFNRVQLYFRNWEGSSNRVHIQVEVEEGWYIFPVPLLELADRNFNVWWVDYGHALNRLNYGIDFRHRNTTGRRDRSKLVLKSGFTQLYQFQYSLPYVNKAKTWGISLSLLAARNREINYATIQNRQAFFRLEDGFALQRLAASAAFTYRPGLNQQQRLRLGYVDNRIDRRIIAWNPNYFLDGRDRQRYFSLSYTLAMDERDVRTYPLHGTFKELELVKDGLGVFHDRNGLSISGDYRYYKQLGEIPGYLAVAIKGQYALIRTPQPYNSNRAIGFLDRTLRGYEYYVVDGPDMFLANTSLRVKLWQYQVNFGKLSPADALRSMPVNVFVSLNSDWGYVHQPWEIYRNTFNNKLLWGRGVGLDMVFFVDFVLRLEASMNHLKEPGLFLHFNTGL